MESPSESEELNMGHNSLEQKPNLNPELHQNNGFPGYAQAETPLSNQSLHYSPWSTPTDPQTLQNCFGSPFMNAMTPLFPMIFPGQNYIDSPVNLGSLQWPTAFNQLMGNQMMNFNMGGIQNDHNISGDFPEQPPVLTPTPIPSFQGELLPPSEAPGFLENCEMPLLSPEGVFPSSASAAPSVGFTGGVNLTPSSVNPDSGRHYNYQPRRRCFSDHQKAVLRGAFAVNQLPKANELETISKMIGLSPKQVKIWFQNQRFRQKKTEREEIVSKYLVREPNQPAQP